MRITTSSCPSIALLVDFLATGYQRDLIEGVALAVSRRGANLFVFAGGWFLDESLNAEGNVIYRHIAKPAVDGVAVAMSTLINNLGAEPGRRVLRNFKLPSVSIGLLVDGVPSVGVDNATGLSELCRHLVGDHGYRRFAMIAGPAHNDESQERVRVAQHTLSKFGVTLAEENVTRQGFLISSGREGITELVDRRHLKLNQLDAIICANDLIAEGALATLGKQGVRVPEDIALTGFDDLDRARYLIPPLSTVRQPLVELGQTAGRLLLQWLDGIEAPPVSMLPSESVVRRSCGCLGSSAKAPPIAVETSAPSSRRSSGGSAGALQLVRRHDLICAALSRAAQGRFSGADTGWESRWVMALFSDLGDRQGLCFLPQVEAALRNLASKRSELELCQEILGVLRDESLLALEDVPASRRLEDMLHAARLMTSSAIERLEVSRRLETTQALNGTLFAVARLTRLVGHTDFWPTLESELVELGIHTCFVTLYTAASGDTSSYLFGFSSAEPLPKDLAGTLFPSEALLPRDILRRPRDYAILVQALVFGHRSLGTLLLSLTAKDIASYDPFASLIALELSRSLAVDR
jgi:DNA-binding LacI/PurR family transcriptional regulator